MTEKNRLKKLTDQQSDRIVYVTNLLNIISFQIRNKAPPISEMKYIKQTVEFVRG